MENDTMDMDEDFSDQSDQLNDFDSQDDISDDNWQEILDESDLNISNDGIKLNDNAESSSSQPVSEKNAMARMGLNDSKAGMSGLDKQKINRIILEATKGSRFYNNEMRKEKQASERAARLKAKLVKITQAQKQMALDELKQMENQLESTRDLSRVIVHIDMDAFYAAIEIRDNPSLADKPMAVGGTGMMVRLVAVNC